MAKLKIGDIAKNAESFLKNWDKDEFIYQFLEVYGTLKTTMTRLKTGNYNQTKLPGELHQKDKLYFRPVGRCDLFEQLDKLEVELCKKVPRFLIVTDFDSLVARDTKLDELLDIKLSDFVANCYFFQPLAGFEKVHFENEREVDVKASDKMAKLFDDIIADNPDFDRHALNVFLSRILFCLFAEDTNIFSDNAFTDYIHTHSEKDGSDLHDKIKEIFDILDSRDRSGINEQLKQFPYVNGGLFKDHYEIPQFSAKSRRMLIDAGRLDWSDIHPDIFGSMFQAVIDPEMRHDLGMHYTSVTNIMKVIRPLFLDKLEEEFAKCKGNQKKLRKLQNRIADLKIFDPACGSGNFLIIAYKELRKLEMKILEELKKFGNVPMSQMTVQQFYGIEYDDFACEVAVLAMWLTEHQMNLEFESKFNRTIPSLPLRDGAKVVHGNACRIDWESVCPKNEKDEIYILGNPPYLGSKVQSIEHKSDIKFVFSSYKNFKDLDYICCWFYLATQYVHRFSAEFAFVTTNSICQGNQVALLWPKLFENDIEISFAYPSFKWTNNAKNKAAVICSVIGLRNSTSTKKQCRIFTSATYKIVDFINPYLIAGSNSIISRRTTPLSAIPKMNTGNMPNNGDAFLFSSAEKNKIVSENHLCEKFFKKIMGSKEFIRGETRWCLWLDDSDLDEVRFIPEVWERIETVKQKRLQSSDKSSRKLAERPHQFRDRRMPVKYQLILPSASSERREYIPMGFLDADVVVSNLANVVYDAEAWTFGVLTSKIHMAWMRITCGRLKTDYRYSNVLCYNNFPIPDLSAKQKEKITEKAMNVLAIRERYPEKTMAFLYDPDTMPDDLRAAHHELDLTVDAVYKKEPFKNDEERLEHLFKLYEKMIKEEKQKSTKKKGK